MAKNQEGSFTFPFLTDRAATDRVKGTFDLDVELV